MRWATTREQQQQQKTQPRILLQYLRDKTTAFFYLIIYVAYLYIFLTLTD